jgi:hypothetical protein
MIVNVAACLYIVQVAIGFLAVMVMPQARMSLATFLSLLIGALIVAMSVGLLKRRGWARWLALGYSLLGWTLGALVLIYATVSLLKAPALAALAFVFMVQSIYGFVVLAFLIVFIVIVVVDFKLFFYLRSPAGTAEFEAETDSDMSLVKSAGVWVAAYMLVYFVTGIHPSSFMPSKRSATTAESSGREREMRESRRRAEREYRMRQQREAEQRAAEQRAAEQRAAEQHPAEVAQADDYESRVAEAQLRSTPTPASEANPVDEAPAPDPQWSDTPRKEEPESTSASRNQILKCRDASGAVQYTQGYCPPGTRKVDPAAN